MRQQHLLGYNQKNKIGCLSQNKTKTKLQQEEYHRNTYDLDIKQNLWIYHKDLTICFVSFKSLARI